MRAGHSVGERNAVLVSDHVLDADLQVGECSTQVSKELSEALWAGNLARGGIVVDGITCNHFVEDAEVAAVDGSGKTLLSTNVTFTSQGISP